MSLCTGLSQLNMGTTMAFDLFNRPMSIAIMANVARTNSIHSNCSIVHRNHSDVCHIIGHRLRDMFESILSFLEINN